MTDKNLKEVIYSTKNLDMSATPAEFVIKTKTGTDIVAFDEIEDIDALRDILWDVKTWWAKLRKPDEK